MHTALAITRLLEATIVELGAAEADGHLRAHSNAWRKGHKHNAWKQAMKGMDMEVALNMKTEYNVLCQSIDTYMNKIAKAFTT